MNNNMNNNHPRSTTDSFSNEAILAAVAERGLRGGARQLGVSKDAMRRRLHQINLQHEAPELILKGTSILTDKAGDLIERWDKTRMRGRLDEETQHIPDPRAISKISTLYDQEGRVSQQWVSEHPDDKRRAELWQEAASAFAEQLPRVPVINLGASSLEVRRDLLTLYPIGDHHMGMLSWKHETGTSYDLDIGERLLTKAMHYLVSGAPRSEIGVVVVLGDFEHYDSPIAVTPEHKNPLDADGRYGKMVRAAIRTIRRAIELALEKHMLVHVIVEIGNHDLYSALWMMEALANIYEANERVTVDTSPRHFHYYRWGKNLFGVHHGHGVKMEDLPLTMATDRPHDWGETVHRHWLTGHIHHRRVLDHAGCTVESFRILPPTDAWGANAGHRAKRDMQAIVYHDEFGEQSRNIVSPWMLEES
jgi:hypothetical protein